MAERLDHLRRQRALLLEHLAWLEAEIARESPSPTLPKPAPAPVAAAAEPAIETSAGDIPAYDVNPASVHRDVKRGCWIYFSAALLLLGLGIVALYFAVARR